MIIDDCATVLFQPHRTLFRPSQRPDTSRIQFDAFAAVADGSRELVTWVPSASFSIPHALQLLLKRISKLRGDTGEY